MHEPVRPPILVAQPAPVAEAPVRPALRFLTCGSVDDGKSTLIGRLLYEQQLIFDDQLAALERDSRTHGTAGDDIDFALLVDGLEAEREQGITIDVAYRYFSTPQRAHSSSPTRPGHEQYTRNMATGASNADLADLLVDARKGLLTQTLRHAVIVSLLGIRHVVLAVNKIDLVDFDEAIFDAIVERFPAFAAPLGFASHRRRSRSRRAMATMSRHRSAKHALVSRPARSSLISKTIDVEDERADQPFRMPVQWVNRPHLDFRGFAGTIASGTVGRATRSSWPHRARPHAIARIVTADGDLDVAQRRRRRDPDARRRDRYRARRYSRSHRKRRPKSPTNSPPI